MDVTHTSYELTVTRFKASQSASRDSSGGSPFGEIRLCTQRSAAVVVDSAPELVVATSVEAVISEVEVSTAPVVGAVSVELSTTVEVSVGSDTTVLDASEEQSSAAR